MRAAVAGGEAWRGGVEGGDVYGAGVLARCGVARAVMRPRGEPVGRGASEEAMASPNLAPASPRKPTPTE